MGRKNHEKYGTVPSGKLTRQWKMDPLKMHFLLKMEIFNCYVSSPEGKFLVKTTLRYMVGT